MKFVDQDTDPDVFYRKVSEDGRLEVCVSPVIYGYRVRAGYAGSFCYELDYCAGDRTETIEQIYRMVLAILSADIPFGYFPEQRVKPMYNDPKCTIQLIDLAAELPQEQVDFHDLHEKKIEYLNKIWTIKK